MKGINRFEDLQIWQNARMICVEIRKDAKDEKWKYEYRFREQILSSSGSIMDNIAEGFERDGNKEFAQFLYIAKASCGEFRSQLYRALDSELISQERFDVLMKMSIDESVRIKNTISSLKNSEFKGDKYR